MVCDLSKLDQQGCNGAPDWIIEILSPATSKKDLTEKFDLYQQAGVKEYWVVHPSEATIIPYRLNTQGQYETLRPTPFVKGEQIPSDHACSNLDVMFATFNGSCWPNLKVASRNHSKRRLGKRT